MQADVRPCSTAEAGGEREVTMVAVTAHEHTDAV